MVNKDNKVYGSVQKLSVFNESCANRSVRCIVYSLHWILSNTQSSILGSTGIQEHAIKVHYC